MEAKVVFAHHGEFRDLDLTDEEQQIAEAAIAAFEDAIANDDVLVVRKSDSYATIIVRGAYDFDLMRFKYNARAKWAAVPMTNSSSKAQRDNPLFAAQKNKNQLVWKAAIELPTDALQLVPFAIESFYESVQVSPDAFNSRKE